MSELPYVISAELELISEELVKPDKIENFRQSLDSELRTLGQQTVWLGAESLQRGMTALAGRTALPVVSLDQRYMPDADAFVGLSRAVDQNLTDAGYDARLGFPPLKQQLDELGRRYAGKQIVLADDVLFSGEMAANLVQKLGQRGVEVPVMICGVAIGEGSEKLTALGIEVESVKAFPNGVEDELCERDFTTLPGSGRKVIGEKCSVLYFDDQNGNPEWASIPLEAASQFCVNSLVRNRQLISADASFPNFLGFPAGLTGEVLDAAIAQRTRA